MQYDYIIVGGGSAGCVAANRLVHDHGARVLLLEAGGGHRRPFVDIPAGAFKMMFGSGDYLVRYDSEPQPSLDGRTVELAQGNLIGGGSSVNAMTYMRGLASDYDRWDAEYGMRGWGWSDLLPYFTRQEGNGRLSGHAHGRYGPLKVQDHRWVCNVAHHFIAAMRGLGVPPRDDFNAGATTGVGLTQITAADGRRCSAANAFLDPIRRNPRLRILTRARVERVLFDGSRATGVRYVVNGTAREARCANEVILTAGAYNDPKLLMLSGIGPVAHLTELGIPVLSDLPGVGQNLQDHNMVPVMALTLPGLGYDGQNRGLGLVLNIIRYAFGRRGPLAANGSEAVAFVNPDDPAGPPTIQIYCLGFLPPDVSDRPGMMLCPTLIQPKSRGEVRLRSADPAASPVISPNYFGDPDDLTLMVRAVGLCRKALTIAPLKADVIQEIAPGPIAVSDEQIASFCRQATFTNYHPVGSCRMGRANDPMAVVDPQLRVRGVSGLRICDASVMPRIPSANTNAPTMVIADKGIDLIMRTAS